ncbi:MAG: hypothetical protein WBO24_04105 [Nitrospirales bacterium]
MPGFHRNPEKDGVTVGMRQIREDLMIGMGGFEPKATAGGQRLEPRGSGGALIADLVNGKVLLGTSDDDGVFGHIDSDIQNGLPTRRLQK